MYKPTNPIYQKVIEFVKTTGKRIKQESGQISDLKQGKIWVTEEDIRIERELSDLILTHNPQAKIYAEEEHSDFDEGEEIWIIDPISHTFSFIHGLPHYAIILSRMIAGEIAFALIYDVSMDEMFVAEKGLGAYLNDNKIKVNPLQSDWALLYDPHPVGEHRREDNLVILNSLMELGRIKTLGSIGLQYAYVACGRVQATISTTQDAFPEFAAKLIVEEAGGLFSNFTDTEFSITDRSFIATADQQTKDKVRNKLKLD